MSKVFAAERVRLNTVELVSQSVDPTAGAGVAAVIGSIYLRSGTAGAYLKTGAGNTEWSLFQQSFDWYSVRDYGAVGDGVTDDRPAIAACIAACVAAGGGLVYFPRGTYLCSKDGANPYSFDLNAVTNITFRGQGSSSLLRQSGNAASGAFSLIRIRGNCSRIKFEQIGFDGAGVTNPATSDHLLEIGTGVGAPNEIQVLQCKFGGMVTGAGDGVHMLGATGNLTTRVQVIDCVFDGCARFGVGMEQGLQNIWVCENFMTNCQTEIAHVSTANAITSMVTVIGNEIIHTHVTEHRAVRLEGDNTGRIGQAVFSDNVIITGFVEVINTYDMASVGNVITSGAYATANSVYRIVRSCDHVTVSNNLLVRSSGATAGPIFSVEPSGGSAPSIIRIGNNVAFNEVTGGTLFTTLDASRISFGDNLFRSANAGATTADAIQVQAVGIAVDAILIQGNQISATSGLFRSAVRLLVNGQNIVNVNMANNMADQIDAGVRYEDAGGGAFAGILQDAGNAWNATTADYTEVGTAVFPHIGLNATPNTIGVTYRTGNGTPEGSVASRVGSLFSRRNGGQDTAWYYKETGTGATGWIAAAGGAVVFGIGNAGTAATALFMAPNYSSATAGATELQIAIPRPGTLRNLEVFAQAAGTDAATVTWTVRKNGVNQTLVASGSNTATGTFNDLVNSFTVVAGDLISIQITKSGIVTAGQGNVTATMELI
jgi:hypothetical protein